MGGGGRGGGDFVPHRYVEEGYRVGDFYREYPGALRGRAGLTEDCGGWGGEGVHG